VLRSRKLAIGGVAVASALAVFGLAAIPTASAANCTVTVKLLGGTLLTLQVPQGVSLSTLSLPAGALVVSESCPQQTTSTSSGTSSTSTTTTKTGTTTTKRSTTTTPKSGGHSTTQKTSTHQQKPSSTQKSSSNKNKGGQTKTTTTPTKPKPSRSTGGVPTSSNPSFSFATPGAAPVGVPNFFIDSFQIPPFLLPIYQAAGIEYDVPWQVLAAINEIETDYGRNLSVSSAGAVGWMQFLPSTWKQWAVDATGNGVADPYNPVDAIFTAARYLHAAGASKNVSRAIFAYNHATWYVQSVLLRAQLIGGLPSQFVGALTGLVEGHFPVAAPAKYADDYVESLAGKKIKHGNPALTIESDPSQKALSIYAKQNSPVIASNDGKVIAIGQNKQWGKYVQLQDSSGNVYTYANLASVPSKYPVPKPVKITAAQVAKELSAPAPKASATAGTQQAARALPRSKQSAAKPISLPVLAPPPKAQETAAVGPAPQVKERLFAYPSRTNSYAAGGSHQIHTASQQISSFQNYFSDVLHLGRNQYTLKALKPGAQVIAGTILGRIGPGDATKASHLQFMIRPAGKHSPYIDPKPILDGWKLLEATAVYRAAGLNPFGKKQPSIGQILLMSKEQLENRVLEDPHVQIYACGRRDIFSGSVDRRVLGVIEYLSASGLDPTVSGLVCGAGHTAGIDQAGQTGASLDISKINGIPIQGHTGPGSITDIAVRRLLTLQGIFKPNEIISSMTYKNQKNTLQMPDHKNRIQVTYTPQFGDNKKLSAQIAQVLKPGQWIQLINRIGQLPEPVVPIAPSKYAIKVGH
jgi:murein DD-endopeptidase MepM/ murein hydrolase activator NlpD